MADYYEEREKRRALLIKRKKRRRIRRIQQIVVIMTAIVLIVLLVKGIKGVVSVGSKLIFKDKAEQSKQVDLQSVKASNGQKNATSEENAVTMTQEQMGEGTLVLVNDSHPIRTSAENRLVELSTLEPEGYSVADSAMRLDKEAAAALDQMLKAFYTETENSAVIVAEGYRSFETQEKLHYESLLSETETPAEGEAAEAAKGVAAVEKPDYSEYQTGYTVRLGLNTGFVPEPFPAEGIYDWFKENGAVYGFVLRYPQAKESFTNHKGDTSQFRYVGVPHAELMAQKNICLEEYISYVQTLTYEKNPVEVTLKNGARYSVYYIENQGAATSVPAPEGRTYTVSGDNDKGFVVAVLLSE